MARYSDAVCRLCRREGGKLFLKGDRCFSPKCAVERRGYPPGQHGQGRSRFSDFGVQLREKQKVKRMYGLLEKQFSRTMNRATRMKGRTGENLLILGGEMVGPRADLIERTSDPIRISEGSFTVGGVTYDAPSQTVLHTMQYPGRPGRFIRPADVNWIGRIADPAG